LTGKAFVAGTICPLSFTGGGEDTAVLATAGITRKYGVEVISF
jgi:hypothetical protein